jgi:hypothetical protein
MAISTTTYGSNTSITMDLSALASSSSLIVGRQSLTVTNATNQYIDALVRGNFTVGTTPAITGGLAVYVWGADIDPATTALGPIVGTDSGCTFTTTSLEATVIFVRKPSVRVATSDTKYQVKPFSVAALFSGVMPKFWGLYVAHDMTAALKTDAANTDSFSYTGITYTTA